MLPADSPLFPVLAGAVAFLYAMVGHGGASGQLAVLSLSSLTPGQISATALALNLVVAGIALVQFGRARHFHWSLTWPFIAGSVPLALLGSLVKLPTERYFALVGLVLAFAAVQLIFGAGKARIETGKWPGVLPAVCIGAAIGLLSGVVGVGGGIFLSPVLVLTGWADPKRTSASSATFIVANSLAGLAGRLHTGIELAPGLGWLVAAGAAGAWAGAWIGARRMSPVGLRRALGLVLLVAAAKLVWQLV